MFHPVGLRDMGYWVVPDFLRFRESMTAAQRAQATAALLFAAYVAAEDEYARCARCSAATRISWRI